MWLLLSGLLVSASCATAPPGIASEYDRNTQFSNFHRFTLIVRPHPGVHGGAWTEQRTYDAIRHELASKGFTYVPEPSHADFAVDFKTGAEDCLDVIPYPPHYVGPFGPAALGYQVRMHEYQERTLAIDVFDTHSRREVWHGSAPKELSQSQPVDPEAPILEAVTAVLETFPPT